MYDAKRYVRGLYTEVLFFVNFEQSAG